LSEKIKGLVQELKKVREKKIKKDDKLIVICPFRPSKHGGDVEYFPSLPWNLVFDQWATLYAPPKSCGDTYVLKHAVHTSSIFFLIIFKFDKLLNHLLAHIIIIIIIKP
jgi:hypothetical protein